MLALTPYQLLALKNNNDKNINDFLKIVSFIMGIDKNIPHFHSIEQTDYFINENILLFSETIIKAALTKRDSNSCELLKLYNYELTDIQNSSWQKIKVADRLKKNKYNYLYDNEGLYLGFIFNSNYLNNLIYKNNGYYGFIKSGNKNFYYCSHD